MIKKHKIKITLFLFVFIIGMIFFLGYISLDKLKESKSKNKNIVTTYKSTIKNNPYSLHVAVGKALTGYPYKNSDDIERAYKKRQLVKVGNSRGVIISDLTHSKPFLQKDAALILAEIGKEFAKASSGKRFIVNSLTRPIQDQKALAKTNPVASPNTSSHSYGVSFDIAYTKFNRNKKYDHDAHRAIEEVLKKFQKDKRIYVIREKQSACYHITVRK